MNNVKLLVSSDESVIYVKVDERRIKQAITNLLSNAIKYPPGYEIVTVNISRQKSEVTISIFDKDPGIALDFQALVFNKFSQSKSKLPRRVGGTGLGLAIVKHIIDAHKGTVTFDADTEKGTRFKINLSF